MNMNQVTLPVRELPPSAKFYRDMGFIQIVDTPSYARFECPNGTATFSLALDEATYLNGSVIYFECRELDALVKILEDKGFVFDQQPEDMSYLWREAVLRDPSNNKIKLYWAGEYRLNPPWRVQRTS